MRRDDSPCACVDGLTVLPTVADVLAFKLRMSGRHDEAVTVEDRHAVLQEGHGPC